MPAQSVSSPAAAKASPAGFTAALVLLALLCLAAPAHSLTLVAPTIDTAITDGPAEGAAIEHDSPTLSFSATRDGEPFPGATFHCSVDSAPAQPCASPIVLGPLEAGAHSFSVYASDPQSSASDPDPAHRSFTVLEEEAECEEFEDEEGFVEEVCEEDEETGLLPPEECMLRSARARLFTYSSQNKVRLVIRYTSFSAADVTVEYRLNGSRGSLKLGSAKRRFAKKGVFRATARLTGPQMEKVRAARRFTVKMSIPGIPGYCSRYDTRHLTIRRTVHSQVVWFQSDSIFGTKR